MNRGLRALLGTEEMAALTELEAPEERRAK